MAEFDAGSSKKTSLARKRRDLDREALDALLGALAPDRESAGRKYEELRRRLINLFSWEQCEAAEDLADETLNRLAGKVMEGTQIPNLDRFAFGIARLLKQEDTRRRRNQQAVLIEFQQSKRPGAELANMDAMEQCLSALAKDRRSLIERYYVEDRATLAGALGISLNALRNRAMRIREELFRCLTAKRDDS